MNFNTVISKEAAANLSGLEGRALRLTATGLALAGTADLVVGTLLRGSTVGRASDIFLSGKFNGLHFVYVGNNTAIVQGDELVQVADGKFVKRVDIAVTGTAADDTISLVAHGLANGTPIIFPTLTGGAGLTALTTTYFVRDAAADTFKVALSPGGTAVDITSNLTAGTIRRAAAHAIAWEAAPANSLDCQIRALLF